MRGAFDDQGRLFSYISPEQRVAARHQLAYGTEREYVEVGLDLVLCMALESRFDPATHDSCTGHVR